ncbi:uncharacterized protein I303_108333 [Kwoniella dejecticola CBS 10117]|uniref:Uncharacterized protein n=1 Tax=Kwoniella dejecticola CBS 10117 TaxID=1296121 RepID=A0A1A5ZXP2_9TREE|nr:uncharacterized protein I303_07340 [Kwoniella dejecticola CBS 10117]OBR82579.1 hypothetical protein I303_07340 [Kwoniella dejecticola CBS 10117]
MARSDEMKTSGEKKRKKDDERDRGTSESRSSSEEKTDGSGSSPPVNKSKRLEKGKARAVADDDDDDDEQSEEELAITRSRLTPAPLRSNNDALKGLSAILENSDEEDDARIARAARDAEGSTAGPSGTQGVAEASQEAAGGAEADAGKKKGKKPLPEYKQLVDRILGVSKKGHKSQERLAMEIDVRKRLQAKESVDTLKAHYAEFKKAAQDRGRRGGVGASATTRAQDSGRSGGDGGAGATTGAQDSARSGGGGGAGGDTGTGRAEIEQADDDEDSLDEPARLSYLPQVSYQDRMSIIAGVPPPSTSAAVKDYVMESSNSVTMLRSVTAKTLSSAKDAIPLVKEWDRRFKAAETEADKRLFEKLYKDAEYVRESLLSLVPVPLQSLRHIDAIIAADARSQSAPQTAPARSPEPMRQSEAGPSCNRPDDD